MRLGKGGGAVADLLRNQLIFWSSNPSRGHFSAQFNQTSTACFFFTMHIECRLKESIPIKITGYYISGRNKAVNQFHPARSQHLFFYILKFSGDDFSV